MPKTRKEKEAAKDKLVDAFKSAKSVVFADYQGLKVAQADKLRKAARESNVDYLVAKKTLFTLAAKEAGYDLDARKFPGMMGGAFGLEDEVAPAKVLGDMAKVTSIKLVGGLFEGKMVDADKVITLSKLPSKLQLLGQVVGTIYAPVSAFVRVLNAIREAMESKSSSVPRTASEEPKVEEKVETSNVSAVESAPETSNVPPEAPIAPVAEAPAAA